MGYTLPTFNLLGKLWDSPHKASLVAADHTNVPCQLYIPSKGLLDIEYGEPTLWVPPVYLRLPIAQLTAWRAMGMAEVPTGSGRYYLARWKERLHQGFPNEYLVALLDQCTSAGVPKAREVDYLLSGSTTGGGGGGGGGGGTLPGGTSSCVGAGVIPHASATYSVACAMGTSVWFKWNAAGSSYFTVDHGVPFGANISTHNMCPSMGASAGPATVVSVMNNDHWVRIDNVTLSSGLVNYQVTPA